MLGKQLNITPYKLYFQLWTLKEVGPSTYTNEYDLYGTTDSIDIHFSVVYPGSIEYYPHEIFTQPPQGNCNFRIEK